MQDRINTKIYYIYNMQIFNNDYMHVWHIDTYCALSLFCRKLITSKTNAKIRESHCNVKLIPFREVANCVSITCLNPISKEIILKLKKTKNRIFAH